MEGSFAEWFESGLNEWHRTKQEKVSNFLCFVGLFDKFDRNDLIWKNLQPAVDRVVSLAELSLDLNGFLLKQLYNSFSQQRSCMCEGGAVD